MAKNRATSDRSAPGQELDGDKKTACIKTMFSNNLDSIGFDYCSFDEKTAYPPWDSG